LGEKWVAKLSLGASPKRRDQKQMRWVGAKGVQKPGKTRGEVKKGKGSLGMER